MGSRSEKKFEASKLQDVQVPLDARQKIKLEAIQRELEATKKAKDDLKEMAQEVASNKEPEMDTDGEGTLEVDAEAQAKVARMEATPAEPVKPIERVVSMPSEENRYEFNQWAAKQEKAGTLGVVLAEAYKADPDLARKIEGYMDRQDGKTAVVRRRKKSGDVETYVDSADTKELRQKESEKAWKKLIDTMKPNELKDVVARTGDEGLRELANQKLAQMGSNGTGSETIAYSKGPETTPEKQSEVSATTAELNDSGFEKWAKKLEKSGGLSKAIAEAALNDPKLAEKLLAYVDKTNETRIGKESYDRKEGIIDATKASELRRKYATESREGIVNGLSAKQLDQLVAITHDPNLKKIAGQRLAQLNLDQMNENMA